MNARVWPSAQLGADPALVRVTDQVKRVKKPEKENGRLRKAVSDLTQMKLILREAASGSEGPRKRSY